MPQDLSAVDWPVRTERLSIRPCTIDDLEATWRFRSAPGVGEWLNQAHDDRAEYEERFRDPERMALILVVEREGEIIGDQMLVIEDAWAQVEVADQARGVQAEIGWIIDPDSRRARATPPRRPPGCSGSASTGSGCAGSTAQCLRRQRVVLAADGADRHAPRAPRRTRLPAPLARVAGHGHRTRSSPTSGGPGRRPTRRPTDHGFLALPTGSYPWEVPNSLVNQ